ncbi:DUF5313 family protein [Williamsia phyllosphaerae]|uniref:DUF5313 domain-containing protein n=1 Tax=Williamsia phyllosphaerae TaxID=885042 RepID=A0ABQ1V3B2_9NOCA|nr:DUF5313 family protein [Williamsia phyllosphaerae]GGF36778.1 hypothetical protein GCM10007298_35630 [Williamsia phyllosphaerae]
MKRPSMIRWIGYAFGRQLPREHQSWVLRDLTGRNAFGRHLFRGMVPFLPIFVVFMLIPGPWWLRAEMVALGLSLALIYSAAYMGQNRRHRLEKHGLDPDLRPARQQQEKDLDRKRYEAIYGRSQVVGTAQLPRDTGGAISSQETRRQGSVYRSHSGKLER